MGRQVSAAVCAWCNHPIASARAGAPETQTICQDCANWTFTHQPLEFEGALQPGVDYFDLPPRDSADKAVKH